jgi:hypothetical protein
MPDTSEILFIKISELGGQKFIYFIILLPKHHVFYLFTLHNICLDRLSGVITDEYKRSGTWIMK